MHSRLDGLEEAFDEALDQAAEVITEAVAEGTANLQRDWRQQVRAAGLGEKMANTVRMKRYPLRGNSLDPAGYIWTKAPGAMDAFDRDPVIVPINGGRYLAIPTENVPRYGRYNRRMPPKEVEKSYRQKLVIIRGRNGNLLGFVRRVAADNKRGFTVAASALRRAGRDADLILMFIFTRSVRVGKRIDLDSAAYYWADWIVDRANLAFS